MYICPNCSAQYQTQDALTKHFLKWWKNIHPYHQSKSAPRSEDKNTSKVTNDILDFFNSYGRNKS